MTARCRSPAQRYGRPAFLRATGLHRQRRSRTRKTHPSGPSEPLAPSRSRGTVKVACRRWTRGTGRFLTQQESMPEARLLWPWPALHSACTHFGGLSSASGLHGIVWKPAQCGRAFVRLRTRRVGRARRLVLPRLPRRSRLRRNRASPPDPPAPLRPAGPLPGPAHPRGIRLLRPARTPPPAAGLRLRPRVRRPGRLPRAQGP